MCYVHNPTPLNSRLSWLSHHPQRLSHTTTAKPPLAWPPPRAAGQEDIWVEEGVMGRGSQKQTREISLPSTFCLCPEQSIAAAGRGELLTPCSLQLPFGPTQGCTAGHPDPAPRCPQQSPSSLPVLLGAPARGSHRGRLLCHQYGSPPVPDHHSPPAQGPPTRANRSSTVRNITGPAGLPAPIPLGPAPAQQHPWQSQEAATTDSR